MNTNPYRLAGWSALLAALTSLFSVVTFVIGMQVGWDKVGLPNDIASVILIAQYFPIFLGLDRMTRASSPALGRILLLVGCLTAAMVAFVQIIFIARIIDFPATIVPTWGGGIVIGLVFIGFNGLAFRNRSFPAALTILGMIAYAGIAVSGVGSLIEQGHPLTWIGGAFGSLTIVWLIWAGWLWLKKAA